MSESASQMVAAARGRIENLAPDQLQEEIQSGATTVIDIREREELAETGRIAGAVHAPRGMLEFYADPSGPYHREEFDPEKRIVLVCASGGRSALATDTLQRMGYTNIAHLDGGLKAWIAQGLPVERDN